MTSSSNTANTCSFYTSLESKFDYKFIRALTACSVLAPLHATSNVVGVRGLLRGKRASLLRKLATASRP